jgi:hypothetical protein
MTQDAGGNTCPRCGQAFHCGAKDSRCDCFDVKLSESLRKELAQHYERCLCLSCLKDLSAGAPLLPEAARR